MDEYISRQDAKKTMAKFIGYGPIDDDMIVRFGIALDRIPSADVRPVVYCKDCIHLGFKDFNGICNGPMCGIVKPWDYCSHGAKMGGDT